MSVGTYVDDFAILKEIERKINCEVTFEVTCRIE